MANRHSENKTSVTILAAKNMAAGLRAIAAEFERLATVMERENATEVEAAGLTSGMTGLVKVSAYCGNIQEAFCVNKSLEVVAEIHGASAALKAKIHRLKDEVVAALKPNQGEALDDEALLNDMPPPGTPRGGIPKKPKRAKK